MRIDVKRLALEYYFGDLQYWKLPRIALEALGEGYDGTALRSLAVMADRSETEIRAGDVQADVDSVFREMGIDAPISKDQARLALASDSAQRAVNGASGVFDAARYIRIRLCELSRPPEVPPVLRRIVELAKQASHAPRSQWDRLEMDMKTALVEFLATQKMVTPE